jgi:hypothetical protein
MESLEASNVPVPNKEMPELLHA